MADVSSYNSNQPSGTSEIRLGDDTLRSRGSDMHAAWTEEHYFRDGSAASGGVHKPGSSRISYGNGPAIASGDEGRLFYDIDDDELVLQGSSATTTVTPNFFGTRLQRASTFAVGGQAGNNQEIEWDEEEYDEGGFHDGGSSRATVPSGGGGFYTITAGVHFASDLNFGVSEEVILSLVESSSGNNLGTYRRSFGTWRAATIATKNQLSDGSAVHLLVTQESGGTVNLTQDRRNFLALHRDDT